jgi:hypothetical protein
MLKNMAKKEKFLKLGLIDLATKKYKGDEWQP